MWLTPGRASGRKNSAPILFINTSGKGVFRGEVQHYWKTDYKPMMMSDLDDVSILQTEEGILVTLQ